MFYYMVCEINELLFVKIFQMFVIITQTKPETKTRTTRHGNKRWLVRVLRERLIIAKLLKFREKQFRLILLIF